MSSPAQFRTDFPEFGDATKTPDSLISLWMTVATNLVNADRWGELADIGIELATAHHLALAQRDANAAASGAAPGAIAAPLSSKSVGPVSASYDTGAVTLTDAGFWAMTSYGLRFLSLARMMGAGPIQIGERDLGGPGTVGTWGPGGRAPGSGGTWG